ncbi:MAG TPA: hypothetical protein VG710_04080 [Opitutus sp.]|nr:hypothetical protein [Opitutus sp.]
MNGRDTSRRKPTARELARCPSAFLPLLLSAAALILLAGHIALFGLAHEVDEGSAAHLWQLLMAGQAAIALFFAVKWLPRAPRAARTILLCQFLAGVAAALPVLVLGL